jgi:membrane protein
MAWAIKPPDWARWKRIGLDVFKTFTDRDTSPRCAATAFFGFLSLFPAIATIVLIYGIFADRQLIIKTFRLLDGVLPPSAMDLIGEQLLSIVSQPPVGLGLGLLISIPLALWSGSRGIDALLYAMSRVRSERVTRNFFQGALISIGLTVLGSVALVIALITVAGLPAITSLFPFPSFAELLVLLIRWPILLAISIALLGPLYRWGPDRHTRNWRYIWPGAVLASILWIIAGVIFSIYVQNWGNYNETFGSVSAAVVLLLWMYNSAQIFVLGAAFNAALEREADPALAAKRAERDASTAETIAAGVPVPRRMTAMDRVRDAVQPKLPWIGLSVAVLAIFFAALATPASEDEDDDRAAA